MARTALAAVLATLALAAPAPASPDAVDEAIAAFEERLRLASDPQARAYAVFELATRKDARVVKALQPLLRHADVDVRVAAARCLGEQGDPGQAAILVPLLEREEDAKEPVPAFVAALVEGIGEADAKGRYRLLKKVTNRWMELDLEVARAGAHAMALARTAEAVEDLIDLLGQSEKRALDQTNDAWKARFRSVGTSIQNELTKLTGREIKTIKAWRDWWKENGKNWKPPAAGAAPEAPAGDPDLWKDAAGKVSLRRPSKAWAPTDPDTSLIEAEARVEGQVVAWIFVHSQDASGMAHPTPTTLAAEKRPGIEEDFKEIRKEATRWAQKTTIGGEKAVLHEVAGRHARHGACTMRYVYALRDGVMYSVIGMCKAARDEPMRREFDALFDSFRFLGR